MKLRDLLIRTKENLFPRLKGKTVVPRVAERVEENLEPLYEKAVRDFREHYDEVLLECAEVHGIDIGPGGEALPGGAPELRVTDRIAGSEALQGMLLTEGIDGENVVLNIAESVMTDAYSTMQHELLHYNLLQRGLEQVTGEEEFIDCFAAKMKEKYGPQT